MDNFKKLSKSKAKKSSDANAPVIDYQAKLAEHGLTREQVIATERKLAKFANTIGFAGTCAFYQTRHGCRCGAFDDSAGRRFERDWL